MKAKEQLLETLTRSETFQNCEHAFTEMTGMPIALRPLEPLQLVLHGKPKENAFCAMIAKQSHACAACLQLQRQLTQTAMDKPAIGVCAYGLCETAVPVKLGSQTIGFLQTGQVLRRKPTAGSFQRAVEQAAKRGADINNEQAKQAYFDTPVASQRKLDSLSRLLVIFADHLAMKSNQLEVQAANVESPTITKAKRFIHQHCWEDISLAQVSNVVNISRFYFCKQFRKATGLSFTEFVTRTRIEKANCLLLNPNLHISEIAFAVGFQSISNFNRMFRRVMGQSPSAYRDKLAAPPVATRPEKWNSRH